MNKLIERLEKATGPDRRLDTAIIDYLFPDQRKFPLEFTASIDSALTLVPENAGLHIDRYWVMPRPEAAWSATISTGGVPDNPRREFEGMDAYTPAIAICIAALKARAALTSTESRT